MHIVPTITADNLITATSGLTIGGGQALAFFEYTNSLVSWTGPFTVAQGGSFYAQRINGEVYLNVSGIALAAATNPNQSINSGVILPVGFRPLTQVNGLLFITSNSTTAVGEYFINTNGTIIIFAGLNGNFFAGAGNANFGDFSSHYSGA